MRTLLAYLLCGAAGVMAVHYGGQGAVAAVILAEIGMTFLLFNHI